MERRVVLRSLDRLEPEPEDAGVEVARRVGVGHGGLVPHQPARLVVDLDAVVAGGLPHPEHGALGVGGDQHPPLPRNVEGRLQDPTPVPGDRLCRRIGVGAGEVGRPGRRLTLALHRPDASGGPTVLQAQDVAAEVLAGVLELPAEHGGVELAGGLHVRHGEVDPAGGPVRPWVGADGHGALLRLRTCASDV